MEQLLIAGFTAVAAAAAALTAGLAYADSQSRDRQRKRAALWQLAHALGRDDEAETAEAVAACRREGIKPPPEVDALGLGRKASHHDVGRRMLTDSTLSWLSDELSTPVHLLSGRPAGEQHVAEALLRSMLEDSAVVVMTINEVHRIFVAADSEEQARIGVLEQLGAIVRADPPDGYLIDQLRRRTSMIRVDPILPGSGGTSVDVVFEVCDREGASLLQTYESTTVSDFDTPGRENRAFLQVRESWTPHLRFLAPVRAPYPRAR